MRIFQHAMFDYRRIVDPIGQEQNLQLQATGQIHKDHIIKNLGVYRQQPGVCQEINLMITRWETNITMGK